MSKFEWHGLRRWVGLGSHGDLHGIMREVAQAGDLLSPRREPSEGTGEVNGTQSVPTTLVLAKLLLSRHTDAALADRTREQLRIESCRLNHLTPAHRILP